MKKGYDQHIHEQSIAVGDEVFVRKNAVKTGESKKLSPVFHKLSEVVEVNMPLLRIKNVASGVTEWRHHNQLRKRNVTPRASGDLRVRFEETASGSTVTDKHTETNRQHSMFLRRQRTPGDNGLEATSTTPNLIDFDDENPTDNEYDNGMGVDGDLIASGDSEIAGEVNNDPFNVITPTSAETTTTVQEQLAPTLPGDLPSAPTNDGITNDQQTTPEENNLRQGHEAALERLDGTARVRSRKTLRTEQLLRNLRPRADRDTAGTNEGADV